MNKQLTLSIALNSQATLDDFLWGLNNELKDQISLLLHGLGERFIYIWGPKASGKTHLLQGCCQAVDKPGLVSYIPLTLFKDAGPDSIEGLETQALIALDDIEAIACDRAWEEALFHLYNRIRDNDHTRLIISSSYPPVNSPIGLPDLQSRLTWGLVYQLQELSDELKIQTLKLQAKKRGFDLPESAALYLINRYSRSMHELTLILDKLDKASLSALRKITIPFIKTILLDNDSSR